MSKGLRFFEGEGPSCDPALASLLDGQRPSRETSDERVNRETQGTDEARW